MFFRRKKKQATAVSDPEPAQEPGVATTADSTQFLTGDQGTDRDRVRVLLEAIERVSDARVSEPEDLDALLIDIVDMSIEVTGAERGLLLLKGDADELGIRVARGHRDGPEGQDLSQATDLRFSTSIANRVYTESKPVRATVQSESEALELGRSVFDLKLRALMCVPLTRGKAGDVPQEEGAEAEVGSGVLYVDSRAATRQFSQGDLSLFLALSQHIATALERARLHLDSLEKVRLQQSLELASVIQRDLMPGVPEEFAGWDLHGWYRPAEQAAGDFYDFVKAKDRLAIVVGDATGHGIGPALITASAQAGLRSYLRVLEKPDQIVGMLNQDICERIEDGRFITLFMGLVDTDGRVSCVNAGHEPPLVWRAATGEIESMGTSGPALGMMEGMDYELLPDIVLDPGDVVVVFTDGITEMRAQADLDTMFGLEGLQRVFSDAASSGLPAREIALKLVASAMEFGAGNQEDDVTLLVARRTADA